MHLVSISTYLLMITITFSVSTRLPLLESPSIPHELWQSSTPKPIQTTSPNFAVRCFNPFSTKLEPTDAEDCEIVINEIILRYPNPMVPQSFGYTDRVDIDLREPQNQKWVYGRCATFVRNMNKSRVDTFRWVDVALVVHKIIKECIADQKYPLGGIANVGSRTEGFFVGVGGVVASAVRNEMVLRLVSSGD